MQKHNLFFASDPLFILFYLFKFCAGNGSSLAFVKCMLVLSSRGLYYVFTPKCLSFINSYKHSFYSTLNPKLTGVLYNTKIIEKRGL